MAGLPWIPLAVDFPDSRKAVALGVALQNPMAWAYIVRLWTWSAKNAQDGRIEGPDAVTVVEHAAGWNGSPGALVEAASLPHIALLDHTEKGFAVHDWSDHCGAHVEKRERDRQRMKKARKAKRSRTVHEHIAHVPGEREIEREKEIEKDLPCPTVSRLPARRVRAGLGPRSGDFCQRLVDGLGEGLTPLQRQDDADELEQLLARFPSVEDAVAFVAATYRKRNTKPGSVAWFLAVLRDAQFTGASQ